MQITLLGTGDAIGVPVPLCECQYCRRSARRRRNGLLVETDETTVLLDAGPDIDEQLRRTDVTELDAVFLTHAHYDHAAGLHAIAQAGKWPADHLAETAEFTPVDDSSAPVYLTETARDHLRATAEYLFPMLDLEPMTAESWISIGDLCVRPVPLEHARPTFETVGFEITDGDVTAAYAPDMARFRGVEPSEVELLVAEGAALFGTPLHGPGDRLREALESVAADRTVVVSLSEHKARKHTNELADSVAGIGYELGSDFNTYHLPAP